jgi:hypothetical protein
MAQYESDDKSGLAMDKEQVQAVDNGIYRGNFDTDDETILAQYDIPDDERRQLLRKLDTRIAPMVMILYLIAFLDRSESAYMLRVLTMSTLTRSSTRLGNIGNAAVGGMTTDLNFPANGLSVIASIFYASKSMYSVEESSESS